MCGGDWFAVLYRVRFWLFGLGFALLRLGFTLWGSLGFCPLGVFGLVPLAVFFHPTFDWILSPFLNLMYPYQVFQIKLFFAYKKKFIQTHK